MYPKDEEWLYEPEFANKSRFQHVVGEKSVDEDTITVACEFRVCPETCLHRFVTETYRLILNETEEADLYQETTLVFNFS